MLGHVRGRADLQLCVPAHMTRFTCQLLVQSWQVPLPYHSSRCQPGCADLSPTKGLYPFTYIFEACCCASAAASGMPR
jgi:hypothetical protein